MVLTSDSLRELEKVQSSLEHEINELEQTLAQRRAALEKLRELIGLAGGKATVRRRGRPAKKATTRAAAAKKTAAKSRAKKDRIRAPRGSNRDRVYNVLKSIGGAERAVNIAQAVKDKYPDFGGKTYKTMVFQILQKDERIAKTGRGMYKAK